MNKHPGKIKKRLKKKYLILLIVVVLLAIVSIFIIKPHLGKNKNSNIKTKDGIVQEMELSIGDKIPSINQFINDKKVDGDIKVYYDDWLVESDTLNEVGTYNVVITTSEKEYYSTIIIKDTIAPTLEVDNLTIPVGKTYDASSFVKSCTDNSNRKCVFYFSNEEMQNYIEKGTYDVKVIARDASYNEIEKNAKLTISDTITNQAEENASKDSMLDTKIEDNVKESYKYGVKVTTTESIYYEVDQNGNKNRIRSKITNAFDRQSYNASSETLIEDAKKQVSENNKIIENTLIEINNYRKGENLPLLKLSQKLNETATIRAIEIAWSGNFSHTRPNGKSSYSISNDLGYDIIILGENLAKGKTYNNPQEAINYWKNTLGSKKNITSSNYNYLGVGVVQINKEYYWVLQFSEDN